MLSCFRFIYLKGEGRENKPELHSCISKAGKWTQALMLEGPMFYQPHGPLLVTFYCSLKGAGWAYPTQHTSSFPVKIFDSQVIEFPILWFAIGFHKLVISWSFGRRERTGPQSHALYCYQRHSLASCVKSYPMHVPLVDLYSIIKVLWSDKTMESWNCSTHNSSYWNLGPTILKKPVFGPPLDAQYLNNEHIRQGR